MTKEALRLALEALECLKRDFDAADVEWEIADQAITAIKEALAQPEQEPVAWRAWVSKFPQGTGSDWVYVTKPIMKDSVHNQPLYTTPPQRTWVGLTDEEIEQGCKESWVTEQAFQSAVWWAEAKLREKNT
jgi:hypothetical protein